jgi:adenylate cyclase
MADAVRKLAAILSADVVGYSRLMAEDEDATVRTLTAYREEVALLVRQHRGRVADFTGDNFLAEFPTATDAVQCAVEIQGVLKVRNAPLSTERKMEFRIGVHLGEVRIEGDRIYGDGVNIAARLEGLAEPGRICISATVHDQVESKLDLVCEDLGEQEVKNIPHPVRVYRVEIPSEPAPRTPGAEMRSRRWLPLGIGVLLVATVVVVSWWRFPSAPPRAPLPTAIAVLPFADMSPGRDQEYFADGMSEELINRLSKTPELRVVARTSAFAFKGKNLDIREIGEQLDVGAVVEGSVRKAGDRLRITAQLIQVADGFHLWSETYERQLDDVFAIQDDISRTIAEALQAHLDMTQPSGPSTTDVRAYELYLMGRFFWNKRTEEGHRKAIQYFEEALELDPEYALAYSGLADSYLLLALNFGLLTEYLAKAGEAATRAVALDDSLAEGHASLGFFRYATYDWPGAEAEFRRALAINPGYAIAHSWYAHLLMATGRIDESLAENRRALQLDPLSSIINAAAGMHHLAARDHETAIDLLERGFELDPDLFTARRLQLGYAYHLAGREADAVEAALGMGFPPEVESLLREASEGSGLRGVARTLLELEVARTGEPCPPHLSFSSSLYAFVEEHERALECIRQEGQRGGLFSWAGFDPTGFLKVGPIWDGLRSDPRFTAILEEMGLGD